MGNTRESRITEAIAGGAAVARFSGVVHASIGGKANLAKAFGWANRAERIPNQIDTRFQTASGTKTFTAIAVLNLVERGRLSLGGSVLELLGDELPRLDPAVTVHHLLTHTSGIPDYFNEEIQPDEEFEKLWWERPCYRMTTSASFFPWIADRPMVSLPGSRFAYNNAGFVVLGRIIERLSAGPVGAFVEETVFRPAGMVDSGYFAAERLPGRTALAYIDEPDGGSRTNIFTIPSVGQGDGGAYTTAPDMQRFWRALHGRRLLNDRLTSAMMSAHAVTPEGSPEPLYGYGIWMRTVGEAPQEVLALGGDPGVNFRSLFFPAEDHVITVIGNSDRPISGIVKAVVEALAT